ncbi:hypothetical protein ACSR0Z_19615 [Streptomyces viridosporus]
MLLPLVAGREPFPPLILERLPEGFDTASRQSERGRDFPLFLPGAA